LPYVQRDGEGRIAALAVQRSTADQEWVEPDSPELRDYLAMLAGSSADLSDALVESDQGLIRVLEDLVETLIAKDMMRFTDLPEAAQQKLMQRRSLRSSVNALKLLQDDDQGLI
jgi:hypothetical protein